MKKIALFLLAAPFLMASTNQEIFHDVDKSSRKSAEPVSVATVKQLLPGMTRRQVRDLIGTPHFSESIIVKHWNYVFNLSDNGRLVGESCQLRIDFTKRRVTKMQWERPACASLVG